MRRPHFHSAVEFEQQLTRDQQLFEAARHLALVASRHTQPEQPDYPVSRKHEPEWFEAVSLTDETRSLSIIENGQIADPQVPPNGHYVYQDRGEIAIDHLNFAVEPGIVQLKTRLYIPEYAGHQIGLTAAQQLQMTRPTEDSQGWFYAPIDSARQITFGSRGPISRIGVNLFVTSLLRSYVESSAL